MSKTIEKRQILVAGTYTQSDAYPNVRYRIKALKQHPALEIMEVQASSSTRLEYASGRSRLLSLLAMAFSQIKKSVACIFAIVRNRHVDALYIPYPAVPILFFLSFIPQKLLPQRIVADVFISLYDTIVVDRQLIAIGSIFARCLRQVERRALSTATVALTDTPENSDYLAVLLGLPGSLFQDLPLSINEEVFRQNSIPDISLASNNLPFKVLFVGTLVPLHRVDLILDAIMLLKPETNIEITFIGDGQQSYLLESFLNQAAYDTSKITVLWIRAWQSSSDIQRYVRETHLCLGIMGNEGKSSRVWPFKNYLYMASGKALITAETQVSARLRDLVDYPVFITVDTTEPDKLAQCLLACADDPGFPGELASNAAQFFNKTLSQQATHDRLFRVVTGT
ncbi:glycosyltransferase [Granulosicoccus antarcticus]|uniref:Glycosyl transferase family 1 domain-containing protein n=1 Tax=Granulosicoccus antarcticus IMCC3135 TaxID=1192854 RepID=A0A2Z2NX00_9GAMM|nr:glycosyltransferase [Granulosicoccus antarcticus]ASJ75869.1 hypothetical protein IMCC3135_29090 [Granulosicoccus antarcticus IMCC3135]